MKNNKKEYFVDLLLKRINEKRDDLLKQWCDPKETNTRHFLIDNLLPQEDVEAIYEALPKNFMLQGYGEVKINPLNLVCYALNTIEWE